MECLSITSQMKKNMGTIRIWAQANLVKNVLNGVFRNWSVVEPKNHKSSPKLYDLQLDLDIIRSAKLMDLAAVLVEKAYNNKNKYKNEFQLSLRYAKR